MRQLFSLDGCCGGGTFDEACIGPAGKGVDKIAGKIRVISGSEDENGDHFGNRR